MSQTTSVPERSLWMVTVVYPVRGKERVRHGKRIATLATSADEAISIAQEQEEKTDGDWSCVTWGRCATIMHFTTTRGVPHPSEEKRAKQRDYDKNRRPMTTRIR